MLPKTIGAWKRLAVALGIVLLLGLLGGGIFVWSGVYNVSAARDHFDVTTWLLEQIRDQSVATQSAFVEVPPLDDPELIKLGGAHYEGVCVSCHARPGGEINAVVGQMLPAPPHLAEALSENTPEEIFWIVKHGLKYTGMPAFPTQSRDGEVWAVTAFLARLMQPGQLEDYRSIAGLDRLPGIMSERPPPSHGTATSALTQCIRCHDDDGKSTHADGIPRLGGQSPDYLRRALLEYASGDRESGIMQPVADALDREEIERFVAYYAALPQPDPNEGEPAADLERGRMLAEVGDDARGIPACLSCHGMSGSRQFPNLAGQNAAYLEQQLTVWRYGGRAATTYGQIMSPIARRLTADQARSVAAYLASLPAQRPELSTATGASAQ